MLTGNTGANGSGMYIWNSEASISDGYHSGSIVNNNSTVSITGGYFSNEQTSYLAEGYTCTQVNADSGDYDYREGYPYALYPNGTVNFESSAGTPVYDGDAIAAGESFTASASYGTTVAAIGYSYRLTSDTAGVFTEGLPTDAGEYPVRMSVAAYTDGVSQIFYPASMSDFTITIAQAANAWTSEPSISGWTYGESAKTPTATATFGEVTFTYSDGANGTFTTDVPAAAGVWYVKAAVGGTDNYKALENIIRFEIEKASLAANNFIVTEVNSAYGDDPLHGDREQ